MKPMRWVILVAAATLLLAGWFAWLTWLVVHIYFLVGFKNRLFVVFQWAWAYLTFRRGARLIVDPDWRDHPAAHAGSDASTPDPPAAHGGSDASAPD